jgi:hypothetical protein
MRYGLTCALVVAAAGLASAEARAAPRRVSANPSAVIAAELAFARLAREKGQWTAFRATAADDAEMLTPHRVKVQAFLKDKPDPPVAVAWQPHEVWMSCDGSAAVTRGAWQGAKATGMFTTVWRRQGDGGYKWVLDQGDPLAAPLPAVEMIGAKVAECTPKPGAAPIPPPPPGSDARAGASSDATLQWSSSVDAAGARVFGVWLWTGHGFDPVLSIAFAAPGPG